MTLERYDYHVHSDYSDGTEAGRMIETATRVGLDGIGFADHVLLSHPEKRREAGYPMDPTTVEDRSNELERLAQSTDVRIFEGVEIDYYPYDEANIGTFLEKHSFDYVVGSVHELSPYRPDDPTSSVHHSNTAHFEGMSETARVEYVDRYFENVVSLIDSGLADILAHLDLIERNDALRGLASTTHYRQVADALAASSAIPEINGAAVTDDWPVLPRQEFFELLLEHDIAFVRGSDAHGTASLETRTARIDEVVQAYDVELKTIRTAGETDPD